MSTVLASFIGKGLGSPGSDSPPGAHYRLATYDFSTAGTSAYRDETSVFGAALVRWLEHMGRPAERWLVLGTSGSMWSDLLLALPESRRTRHLDEASRLAALGDAGRVEEADISAWEERLGEEFAPLDIRFRRVDDARGEAGQVALWGALDDSTAAGDELVLDITHGWRHLPMLAGFMAMLLARRKPLAGVDLFYGGLDVVPQDVPLKPVLHLPLCNELLRATEALSTYQLTGQYEPLAEVMGLSESVREQVDGLRFHEETNRINPGIARTILNATNQAPRGISTDAIRPSFQQALEWAEGGDLVEHMERRARRAFDHRSYFEAFLILWEALLVGGCRCYEDLRDRTWLNRCDKPGDEHDLREEAERRLRREADTCLPERADREAFKDLEHVRNGIAHGTTAGLRVGARRALGSEPDLRRLFEEGLRLLGILKTHSL